MSTNYYVLLNECDCCQRADSVHLAKTSGGVSIQGFDDHEVFGPIHSLQDWVDALKNRRFSIVDEYGRKWDLDVVLDSFRGYDFPERRRQFDWVVSHPSQVTGSYRCSLDAERFTISYGEWF